MVIKREKSHLPAAKTEGKKAGSTGITVAKTEAEYINL